MTHFLGIDPGMTGGFAIVDSRSRIVVTLPMPVVAKTLDGKAIREFLKGNPVTWAMLEQVHSMPGQGIASTGKFMMVYGFVTGMLEALQVSYTLATPQRWQKVMHAGVASAASMGPKERSRLVAQRLYPKETFLATERSKKPHEGIVDAVLIAEYCRRTFDGVKG